MTDPPSSHRRSNHWRGATVAGRHREGPLATTLTLSVDGWAGHRAGQHVDVRLTAPDGYQATRSYSLSSGAGEPPQISVTRVDGGEVSPYLVDEARPGDQLEVRGPVGGYFVWDEELGRGPVLLVGGGSGVAPLRAIWRTAMRHHVPVHLAYSARDRDHLQHAGEIDAVGFTSAVVTLTRQAAPGYRYGRLQAADLRPRPGEDVLTYVCGPTVFVEWATGVLAGTAVSPGRLRAERFG